MANFNSTNVEVFPAGRRTGHEKNKILSEDALTRIIKAISVNLDGTFIVNENADPLEFFIDGYYFSINKSTLASAIQQASATDLYVKINTQEVTDYGYEIKGDNNNLFTGLEYTTTETQGYVHLGSLNNGVFVPNHDLSITKQREQKCFTIGTGAPTEETSKEVLYIDNTFNQERMYFNNNGTWVPLGAVYKTTN